MSRPRGPGGGRRGRGGPPDKRGAGGQGARGGAGRGGGRSGRVPPARGERAPARRAAPSRGAPRGSSSKGLGGEQVEGRQAVRELLLAGRRRIRDVWLVDDNDDAPILTDIVELAGELGVTLRRVGRTAFDAEARTEVPQGVLAHAAPIPEVELDDLCRPAAGRQPFLVLLDGITDPQNLGAILRTAECAGATGVVLPRHRAAHVTPAAAKAAAGAIEHLPMALVAGLPAALTRIREQGVWAVGLDAGGERTLFDLELGPEPVALVLGAEGSGLARLTRERCDLVVSIPLRGALASLNVSASAALACYEVARRRP